MELVNNQTCKFIQEPANIILGIYNYIVSVPHQTFGAHVDSIGEKLESSVDQIAFNSLNGEFFIADNNLRKIKTFSMKSKVEKDLITQHILSVKSMAFGKF